MKLKFNKDFWEDLISITIALAAMCIPAGAIGWFIYKVAKGAYHLLDKLIDKL